MRRAIYILMAVCLMSTAAFYGCGTKNDPKPKPESSYVDGYWKGFLFTSYKDSAAMVLRDGRMNIYLAHDQAIDTNTMKPLWKGTYSLKGDSIFFTMAPDVYGHIQRGKGMWEPPIDLNPATMEIDYYYDDANGTGLYEMIKQ